MKCCYCGRKIDWPFDHIVTDQDRGMTYHSECYAEYKAEQLRDIINR